jgi:hypothetical protein
VIFKYSFFFNTISKTIKYLLFFRKKNPLKKADFKI